MCQFLQVLDFEFDVIILSEIWTYNIESYCNILEGYTFLYDLPSGTNIGGIGIYVKNTFHVKEMQHLKITTSVDSKIENIWLEICSPDKKNIVGGIYRHPNKEIKTFQRSLETTLEKVARKKTPCIIAGDLNIDLIKYSSHADTKAYIDSIVANGFMPVITLPTRITAKSATLIDHIYYYEGKNMKRDISTKSGNLTVEITDHLSNYVFLTNDKNNRSKYNKNNRPTIRLFNDKNKANFAKDLKNIKWDKLYDCTNVNSAYGFFIKRILNSFDKNFQPIKLSRKRARDKKWITPGLRKSSAEKNKLYKVWLQTRNTEDELKYKKYKILFKKLAEESEKLYYSNQFNIKTRNTKELWANLNTVCSFKKKKSKLHVSKLLINNREVTDTKEIVDVFNTYFSKIGTDIAMKIKDNSSGANECFKTFCDPPLQNSMYCEPPNKSEVLEIIEGLKSSKSPGNDNIGPKLLKFVSTELVTPLTYIYKLSFESGTVPDELKIAKIIPIFKKGETTLPANYRPISLLSVFDKILEKLMFKRVTNFLNKNNVIYKNQFGFRKHHSTTLALIEAIDNLYKLLDENKTVIGLFLDFEKAFDTVNHEILLYKLNNYGIRGTTHEWFKNYLTNRKQFVSVDGVSSSLLDIQCGVPQGSILGPLLFLIYINDIHNSVPERNIKLFADDANIFLHSKTVEESVKLTQTCLANIQRWCSANKISINYSKTTYSIFSRGVTNDYTEIAVGSHKISRAYASKYLGVIIDEKLT